MIVNKVNILLIIITSIFSINSQLCTQNFFREEWIRHHAGPDSLEYKNYISIDKEGNSYVLIESVSPQTKYDYEIIKYDYKGELKWTARFVGPNLGWDYPRAIAVDDSGNIYVTGNISSVSNKKDICTIKYNTYGIEQWRTIYNGPDELNERPYEIIIDRENFIYICGSTEKYNDQSWDYDFLTIKYNSSGKEEWVRFYDKPENGLDVACSMVVDDSENVFVTGSSGPQFESDFLTIKYDRMGLERWFARYTRNQNESHIPRDIALDDSGNVIVIGYGTDEKTLNDFITTKYDRNGVLLWDKQYNGTGNFEDHAQSLVVDYSCNIYVSGNSGGVGTKDDFAVVKYNSNGVEKWINRYDGPAHDMDEVVRSVMDHKGNLYIAGSCLGTNTGEDYTVLKYSPSGDLLWKYIYNGPQNTVDILTDMVIDTLLNLYITGYSQFQFQSGWSIVTTIKLIQENSSKLFFKETNINTIHLFQNYPNPFNPITIFKFDLPKTSNVTLKIYNILGEEVASLVSNRLNAGAHEYEWSRPAGMASGVYLYRLEAEGYIETKKMILIR